MLIEQAAEDHGLEHFQPRAPAVPRSLCLIRTNASHYGWGSRLEVFETMVFGGLLDQHTWRSATRVQAEATHAVRR